VRRCRYRHGFANGSTGALSGNLKTKRVRRQWGGSGLGFAKSNIPKEFAGFYLFGKPVYFNNDIDPPTNPNIVLGRVRVMEADDVLAVKSNGLGDDCCAELEWIEMKRNTKCSN
jgi:hypothetical protein